MPDAAPAGAFRRQPGVSRGVGESRERRGWATLGASFGVPSGVRRVFAPTDGSTRVVLVRHGEAVCNINGIVGGQRGCTGLTELGRRQVMALAERLATTGELDGATALYSSTLPRAVETAGLLQPVVGKGDLQIVQDRSLSELFPGDADGLGWHEVVDRFGVPEWDTDPDRLIAPGGESWSGFVAACLRGRARPGRAAPGRAGGGGGARRSHRIHDDRQPGHSTGSLPAGMDPHRACLVDRVGVGAAPAALDPAALQRRVRDPGSAGPLISRHSPRRRRSRCCCTGRSGPAPWGVAPGPASSRPWRTSPDRWPG